MRPSRERPELSDLTPAEIEPLEALFFDGFPDIWCDLARSQYLTLLMLRDSQTLAELAELAVQLTRGIAQDLGGSQPYIPVGHFFAAGAKAMRIVEGFRGDNHHELAAREGVTESRVRQILAAWRREDIARRQGTLALE